MRDKIPVPDLKQKPVEKAEEMPKPSEVVVPALP